MNKDNQREELIKHNMAVTGDTREGAEAAVDDILEDQKRDDEIWRQHDIDALYEACITFVNSGLVEGKKANLSQNGMVNIISYASGSANFKAKMWAVIAVAEQLKKELGDLWTGNCRLSSRSRSWMRWRRGLTSTSRLVPPRHLSAQSLVPSM